ncbi:phospho-sugar mutase [Sinomonas sp. ASV486]|uniref:phospho-sugar mutase n=1 Tax=Sinomonas sp. ASV486 TaxID=3051170 RepID=UPI0027DC4BD6|nr:phospho-sugar mutase [Sinomonas sp. ASV486]MDQ4490373.1 phospho-sugar mutase [Sinomonas sp. ASV486]
MSTLPPGTPDLAELAPLAEAWAATDPDPETAAQLRETLARASEADPSPARDAAVQELSDAFSGTLQFGTAGLRAALGPGPNRMNRVTVRRAAAGIAAFLTRRVSAADDDGAPPRAVVGYDARTNSDVFAAETAAIFTAAGIDACLLPSALPTPVLAYALRALGCDAGVMVTASHNPPQDNGYKVYLGGRAVEEAGRGAQIVAPIDAEISELIGSVGPVGDIALAESGWTVLPASIAADYRGAVVRLAKPEMFPARDLRVVLTPMHGVGGETAISVLTAAGFTDVSLVPEQAQPDPAFPTVAFPNPEEAGALDLAIDAAKSAGADLVIANDPDADRCAVAAPDPATGEWRMLRGDEVGALLGSHVARRLGRAQGLTDDDVPLPPADGSPAADPLAAADGDLAASEAAPVFANSIVSSRLLARIAASAGLGHRETLTGFKWISRVPGLVYGYEEALGYCVAPGLVRDKDGISAALLVAELAADAKAHGQTVFDRLDALHVLHGVHLTDQLSVRVADLGLLDAMMTRLRHDPPASFADSPVETALDLSTGSEELPPTEGLQWVTRDATRVIIRPSGTEPKLKCYLEVIRPVDNSAELGEARQAARHALDAAIDDVREALGL